MKHVLLLLVLPLVLVGCDEQQTAEIEGRFLSPSRGRQAFPVSQIPIGICNALYWKTICLSVQRDMREENAKFHSLKSQYDNRDVFWLDFDSLDQQEAAIDAELLKLRKAVRDLGHGADINEDSYVVTIPP